jgi:hypothetical protein
MKFCLLTLGQDEPEARFAFFLTEPGQLAEPDRNFTLSPDQIAAINPNTKTAPVFRSRADAELTAKIYRNARVLIEEGKGPAGNPWKVDFHTRLWHMSEDSAWFQTFDDLHRIRARQSGSVWSHESDQYLPLFEAKMLHHFDHRWGSYTEHGAQFFEPSGDTKANPEFEILPRYWVPEAEVIRRLGTKDWSHGWLLGWRDITNATNERTFISTVSPRTAINNKFPLIFPRGEIREVCGLIANSTALSLDFIARQKVGGTNLTLFMLFQLPILPPAFYTSSRLAFITPKVLELTYTSHSLAPFARDLGYDGPPFPWDEARRAYLRAELDAFYARAYGLTRDELRYILDPADVRGPDYPSETFRVLKEKEIRQHGEYRTRRLVLEAWDRMEADGTFKSMEM